MPLSAEINMRGRRQASQLAFPKFPLTMLTCSVVANKIQLFNWIRATASEKLGETVRGELKWTSEFEVIKNIQWDFNIESVKCENLAISSASNAIQISLCGNIDIKSGKKLQSSKILVETSQRINLNNHRLWPVEKSFAATRRSESLQKSSNRVGGWKHCRFPTECRLPSNDLKASVSLPVDFPIKINLDLLYVYQTTIPISLAQSESILDDFFFFLFFIC